MYHRIDGTCSGVEESNKRSDTCEIIKLVWWIRSCPIAINVYANVYDNGKYIVCLGCECGPAGRMT